MTEYARPLTEPLDRLAGASGDFASGLRSRLPNMNVAAVPNALDAQAARVASKLPSGAGAGGSAVVVLWSGLVAVSAIFGIISSGIIVNHASVTYPHNLAADLLSLGSSLCLVLAGFVAPLLAFHINRCVAFDSNTLPRRGIIGLAAQWWAPIYLLATLLLAGADAMRLWQHGSKIRESLMIVSPDATWTAGRLLLQLAVAGKAVAEVPVFLDILKALRISDWDFPGVRDRSHAAWGAVRSVFFLLAAGLIQLAPLVATLFLALRDEWPFGGACSETAPAVAGCAGSSFASVLHSINCPRLALPTVRSTWTAIFACRQRHQHRQQGHLAQRDGPVSPGTRHPYQAWPRSWSLGACTGIVGIVAWMSERSWSILSWPLASVHSQTE